MKTKWQLTVECAQGHQTHQTLVSPTFTTLDDGTIRIKGLLGSGADFCDVCNGPIVRDVEVSEVPS